MSRFQERLWSELIGDQAATALAAPRARHGSHASLPIVERRRIALPTLSKLRSMRLVAGAAALASAVTVLLVVTGTSTPPSAAYAVTVTAGGTLEITIDELTGVTGANAELAKLGVSVKVVPVRAGCALSSAILIPQALDGVLVHAEGQGLAIQPNLIPHGDVLIVTARRLGPDVGLTSALYRASNVPPCVPPGYSNVR